MRTGAAVLAIASVILLGACGGGGALPARAEHPGADAGEPRRGHRQHHTGLAGGPAFERQRGVIGTYHNVSKAYLPFYLTEFSFRHNNRYHEDMFAAVVGAC
jgi:hypothetical protein